MRIVPIVLAILATSCVSAELTITQPLPIPAITQTVPSTATQSLSSPQPSLTATKGLTLYPTYTPSLTRTTRPTLTPTQTQVAGSFGLRFYDLALAYKSDIWEFQEGDPHSKLVHRSIPNCEINEHGPSEVLGKYVNTTTLGPAIYEIFGGTDFETRITAYEYIIINKQFHNETSGYPVVIAVTPLDDSLACLVQVYSVLMTVHFIEN